MTCRILLCDGNNFFRQSLQKILLGRFPEIDIDEAVTSKECAAKIQEFLPHIVFIDLHLHGQKGFDLIKHVREEHPATIIIIFTEYNLDEYRIPVLLAGGNYVIPKELWTGREILVLVETALKNQGFNVPGGDIEESVAEIFLERPIDRRKNMRSKKGQNFEKEFLLNNPERRKNEQYK